MHAHGIIWAHMCVVQYNLLVYVGAQIVWEFVCVISEHRCRRFCVHFTLSCKTSLTLTPLCYSDRNPQWSDLSAPRGREIASLCFVLADETPVDCDQAPCTNRSSEGVCAGSADWKNSFCSLAWQHTHSVPRIHLQGFSFTMDIRYASTFAQLEWKILHIVVANNDCSKQLWKWQDVFIKLLKYVDGWMDGYG